MIRRSKSCTSVSTCCNTSTSSITTNIIRCHRRIVQMFNNCDPLYQLLIYNNNNINNINNCFNNNNNYRYRSSVSLLVPSRSLSSSSLLVPLRSFVPNNNNNYNCIVNNNPKMLGSIQHTTSTVQRIYSIPQSPTKSIMDTIYCTKTTRNYSSFSSSSSSSSSIASVQRNFSTASAAAAKPKTKSSSTIIERRNDIVSKRMYRILLRLCNDLETYINNNKQSLQLIDRELSLLKSSKQRRRQQQQQQQRKRFLTTSEIIQDNHQYNDTKISYNKYQKSRISRLSLLKSQLLQKEEEEQQQQQEDEPCQFLLQRPIDPTEAGTYRLLELISNSTSNSNLESSLYNDNSNNNNNNNNNNKNRSNSNSNSNSNSSGTYESNIRKQDDDDLSSLLRYLYLYDYTKPDTYDDSFFSSDEDSDDDSDDDDSDSDDSSDDDNDNNGSTGDNDEHNSSSSNNNKDVVKKAKQKKDDVIWKDLMDSYKQQHNSNDDDDDDIDDIDSVLRLYKYKNEFIETMNHSYNNDNYNNNNNNSTRYDMDDTFDNDDYDSSNNNNASNNNNSTSNNDMDRVERENNVIAGFVLHLMENEYNLNKIIEDIHNSDNDSDDNENNSDNSDTSDIDDSDDDSDHGEEYSFGSQQRAIEFEEKQSYYNTIINQRNENNIYNSNNNVMKIHDNTTIDEDTYISENDNDDDSDIDDNDIEKTERQRQSDNILNDFDNYEHVTLVTSVNKIRAAIRYVFRKSKDPIIVPVPVVQKGVPVNTTTFTTASTDNQTNSNSSTGTYNIVSKATKIQYALEAYRLLKQQLVYVLPNTSISYDHNVQITIFTQYIGKSTGDTVDWGSSRNYHHSTTTSTTASTTTSTGTSNSNEKRGSTSSSSRNLPYYYESTKYLYAYRIRIENHSLTDTIQLLGRKWDIHDSYLDDSSTNSTTTSISTSGTGSTDDVMRNGMSSLLVRYQKKEPYRINVPDGGVAGGQQPILLPGSVFEYISGAEAGECGLLKGNFYFTKINTNTNDTDYLVDHNEQEQSATAAIYNNANDNNDATNVTDSITIEKENYEKKIPKKKKQQQKIQERQSKLNSRKKLSRKDQFEVHVAPVKLISVL